MSVVRGVSSNLSAAKDTITPLNTIDRVSTSNIPKLNALGPYLKHLQVLISEKLMLNSRLTHIIVAQTMSIKGHISIGLSSIHQQGLGKTALEQQEKIQPTANIWVKATQMQYSSAAGTQQVNSKQQTDSRATQQH